MCDRDFVPAKELSGMVWNIPREPYENNIDVIEKLETFSRILKDRGGRPRQKRPLKSEFAFLEFSSRLFQLTYLSNWKVRLHLTK